MEEGIAMNIFVLDEDPVVAAQYHCDKHVVKMILESAQIACSALHLHGIATTYKPTHLKHPCVLWASAGRINMEWLLMLGFELGVEHSNRYPRSKPHKSLNVILECASHLSTIPPGSTPFVQAMPEQYQQADAVQAYREYYRKDKKRLATWSLPSKVPEWMYENATR